MALSLALRGEVALRDGRISDAAADARAARDLAPQIADESFSRFTGRAWFVTGLVYEAQGRRREARDAFATAAVQFAGAVGDGASRHAARARGIARTSRTPDLRNDVRIACPVRCRARVRSPCDFSCPGEMMKAVMRELAQAKRHYSKLPLFEFLRAESIPPRDRLAFYPAWRRSSWRSRISTASCCASRTRRIRTSSSINEHTHEDDHHWPWYLEDFTKLGFDRTASVTQTLRSYMKDGSRQNRMLGTRLAQLLHGTTPTEKLVIVEAIEETGNVLFGLTAKIAARIQADGGPELVYLGQFHFSRETGHAMHGHDHRVLEAIPLTELERARCLDLAFRVFDMFSDWTTELLAFAKNSLAHRTVPCHSRCAPTRNPDHAVTRHARPIAASRAGPRQWRRSQHRRAGDRRCAGECRASSPTWSWAAVRARCSARVSPRAWTGEQGLEAAKQLWSAELTAAEALERVPRTHRADASCVSTRASRCAMRA